MMKTSHIIFLSNIQPLWASHLVVLVDETTQTPTTTLQGFPILVGLGIPLFWKLFDLLFWKQPNDGIPFLFPFSTPRNRGWAVLIGHWHHCVSTYSLASIQFFTFLFFWASGRHLTGTSSPGLISFETFPPEKNKKKIAQVVCIYTSQRFAGHSLSLMVIERKR